MCMRVYAYVCVCDGCSIKHLLLKYVLKLHSSRAAVVVVVVLVLVDIKQCLHFYTQTTIYSMYIVHRTSYTIYTTVPTLVELLNKLAVRVNECLNMCRIHVEGSSAAAPLIIWGETNGGGKFIAGWKIENCSQRMQTTGDGKWNSSWIHLGVLQKCWRQNSIMNVVNRERLRLWLILFQALQFWILVKYNIQKRVSSG